MELTAYIHGNSKHRLNIDANTYISDSLVVGNAPSSSLSDYINNQGDNGGFQLTVVGNARVALGKLEINNSLTSGAAGSIELGDGEIECTSDNIPSEYSLPGPWRVKDLKFKLPVSDSVIGEKNPVLHLRGEITSVPTATQPRYTIVPAQAIFNSDISLNSNLYVGKDVSFNGDLFVDGDISLNDNLYVGKDVSFNQDLFVDGDISLNGNLFVGKDVSFNQDLFVGEKLGIGTADPSETLDVSGNAVITGNIVVYGTDNNDSQKLTMIVDGNPQIWFGSDYQIGDSSRIQGDSTPVHANMVIRLNNENMVGYWYYLNNTTPSKRAIFECYIQAESAYFSGDVGIGVTYPNIATKLHVNGDITGNNLFLGGDISANDASFNNIQFFGKIFKNDGTEFVGGGGGGYNSGDLTVDGSLNATGNLIVEGVLTAGSNSNTNVKILVATEGDDEGRPQIWFNTDAAAGGRSRIVGYSKVTGVEEIDVANNVVVTRWSLDECIVIKLKNADMVTFTNNGSAKTANFECHIIAEELTVKNSTSQYMEYNSVGNLEVRDPEDTGTLVRLGSAYSLPGLYSNGDLNLMSNKDIIFRYQNTENMRITSSGNLTLGGTMTVNGNARVGTETKPGVLHVQSSYWAGELVFGQPDYRHRAYIQGGRSGGVSLTDRFMIRMYCSDFATGNDDPVERFTIYGANNNSSYPAEAIVNCQLTVNDNLTLGGNIKPSTGELRYYVSHTYPDIYMGAYNDNIGFFGAGYPSGGWMNRFTTLHGYIKRGANVGALDFTGQHRAFVEDITYKDVDTYEGLIVCANKNEYISLSNDLLRGRDAILQNESLPLVSLCKKEKDKTCFGVISSGEDPEMRVDKFGCFASVSKKQIGDTRIYINSVGEGAMWVCNRTGNLESGDYITTSSLAGYGQKQEDDILHNFTVAKITMDCSFNPPIQPKQIILKENDVNMLDSNGLIQWTNKLDENDEIVYEEKYKIRYVDKDGNIISKDDYDRQESNGEVFICAYVGVTYHCG